MSTKKHKSEFYLGNPNLPNKEWKGEYTKEMVLDIKKCKEDLLYFAQNFFYIIDPDIGKVKIKLYNYQKRMLKKLRDNKRVVLLASRQCGKALALSTPIPTPSGWVTMGDLKDGDIVYDHLGNTCRIVKAHEIRYNRPCYKIEFSNGDSVVADEEHNWFTYYNSYGKVRTTRELLSNYKNHSIKTCRKYSEEEWIYITNIQQVPSVPVRCITVDGPNHMFLCGKTYIPTHNSTMLTIYALWVACFNNYQNSVLVANKEATAIEIFRRVRLAYEELPNWLKPGVIEWGKTSMELSNGSRIGISTTTGSAARGQTINLLLIDEMAFIEPKSILEDFWRSVYPTISRSKTAKVLIASTPNGTDNLFYNVYDGAEKGENGFVYERVPWYDVPGRNDDWRQEQIKALGSAESFLQEYEIQFLNSGDSSIDEALFYELAQSCCDPKILLDGGHYKIWEEPDTSGSRLYVAGVDISEGLGIDASVIQILDITDLSDIRQVAMYHNNTIPPLEFSNKVYSILRNWGSPLALIERNNCGAQVVDRLAFDMGYEKVVSYGARVANRNKPQMGMIAHTNTKYKGVMNMRYFVNEIKNVSFRDIHTLKELKNFVRYPNGGWKAKSGYHDDRVMSLMYALYILEKELTERFFEIIEFDDTGKPKTIEPIDFGVSMFEDPTSIYTDNEIVGDNNHTVAPVVFGLGDVGTEEMQMLIDDGYTQLGNYK